MTRGRRAYPESSNPAFLANTREPGISASARGVPLQTQGWARESKRSSKRGQFSFLRAMPSSHTPSGSCRKTNSREKALGARTEPRPTRKMSAFFSGFLCRGGLLLSFLWYRIHKMMAAVFPFVCGTARNRIG